MTDGPLQADEAETRRFLEVIHAAAAHALRDVTKPGYLQMSVLHQANGKMVPTRYRIGDVDGMLRAALIAASFGQNVYIEGRTIAEHVSGNGRGGEDATRGVFALVVDADADKDKGGRSPVPASLTVETSPGNAHDWIFLDRALTVERAKAIGEALRAATGADHDTGVVTQPYRVAGTPNFPSPKKAARGRVPTPTRILERVGRLYAAEELLVALPPQAEPKPPREPRRAATGPASPNARHAVEKLLAEPVTPGMDRSVQFQKAANKAERLGMTPEELEAVARLHPDGCAGKYLEGRDRLTAEVYRSWEKALAQERQADDPSAPPTYPSTERPVGEARRENNACLGRAWPDADTWHAERVAKDGDMNTFEQYGEQFNDQGETPAPAYAMRIDPGGGKTTMAAASVKDRPNRKVRYFVPRHKLGDEIVKNHWEGHPARVIRGRDADDPERAGMTQHKKMCWRPEVTKAAIDLGMPVETSCCKAKKPNGDVVMCPFFNDCGWQKEYRNLPDTIVLAHEMLFVANERIKDPYIVFIDENFMKAAEWTAKPLALDELTRKLPLHPKCDTRFLQEARGKLHTALTAQTEDGEVARRHLVAAGLTAEDCAKAFKAEWSRKEELTFYPDMDDEHRKRIVNLAQGIRHIRRVGNVWKEAEKLLLDSNEDAVAANMWLHTAERDEGQVRVVTTRGLKAIAKQWQVPTFIMDATLPPIEVLRAFYPQVEILADISIKRPHTKHRLVTGGAVSQNRLFDDRSNAQRNLRRLRRYILQRWYETGCGETLVVCRGRKEQEGDDERDPDTVEAWLKRSDLPAAIKIEHFNAVSGLDGYRRARLCIIIDRTQPGPEVFEAQAARYSGRVPVKATARPGRPRWFNKVTRYVRMRDGSTRGVLCDQHPDPLAEQLRWLVCEAGLLQAIGRMRSVNRTEATADFIDVIADVCLPLTFDEVVTMDQVEASAVIEMVADGVVLDSPTDMAVCWPHVWATRDAAAMWLKHERRAGRFPGQIALDNILISVLTRKPSHPAVIAYRPAGQGQQTRQAVFDLERHPDPRVWLEGKLGALGHYEVVEPAPPSRIVAAVGSAVGAAQVGAEGRLANPPETWCANYDLVERRWCLELLGKPLSCAHPRLRRPNGRSAGASRYWLQ